MNMNFLLFNIFFICMIILVFHDIKSDRLSSCFAKFHTLSSGELSELGFKFVRYDPKTRFSGSYIYQYKKYLFEVLVFELFSIKVYSKTRINLAHDSMKYKAPGMKYSVLKYGNRKNLFTLYKLVKKGHSITDQREILMKAFNEDLNQSYTKFNIVRKFMNK